MTTKAKICGLKTLAGLDAALDGGADYVGLVFFPKSPRHVTLAEAAELAGHARGRAKIVALTVDADDATLDGIVAHASPDVLQLHGHETPRRTAEIRQRIGCEVWKALPVATPADAACAEAYSGSADLILFDAKPPKDAVLPGGNGLAFDWTALDAVKGRLPFMLSGGLTPDNVAEAIRMTTPWGVDVSSGVESAPGIKDAAKIEAFLRAVKQIKYHAQTIPSPRPLRGEG